MSDSPRVAGTLRLSLLNEMRLSIYNCPLLYVATAFSLGIAADGIPLYITVTVWAVVSITLFAKCHSAITIPLLLITSFMLGGAIQDVDKSSISQNNISRLFDNRFLTVDDNVILTGTLINNPEMAPHRYYLNVNIEKLSIRNKDISPTGTARIVVPLKTSEERIKYDSLNLEYGTRIILQCKLKNQIGYRNPGAPDFTELLNHKGIDVIGSVNNPSLIYNIGGNSSGLKATLFRLRSEMIEIIITHFKQPASGILAASLFGNKYYLTYETAESFRIGGTFHLLVISGMHITVIAMIVLWLTKFLSNSRLLKYIIVTAFMWAYAIMIGFEPAITRAVVMLNLILIGRVIFRQSNGINLISSGAMILLIWTPTDLFNPGFQLSFITVVIIFGIIQPLYTNLKAIGKWDISPATPYPPRVNKIVKHIAEALFWNEPEFQKKRQESSIKYRLIKSPVSRFLSKPVIQFQSISVIPQKIIAWVIAIVISSGIIQVALLPLNISLFHRVSLISPITNVIECIFISILMCGGGIAVLIHYLFDIDKIRLDVLIDALGKLLLTTSEPLHKFKWSNARIPDGGESAYLFYFIYFISIIAIIFIINEWNPLAKGDEKYAKPKLYAGTIISIISLFIIAVITIVFLLPVKARQPEGNRLSLTFLDVGQGDSVLIEFPKGSKMLLDAGGKAVYQRNKSKDTTDDAEEDFNEDRIGIAEASVMPYLWYRGISRLDWIVASHEHWDHIEGFTDIIKYFEIHHALKSNISTAPPGPFETCVNNSRIPLSKLKEGDKLVIDNVELQVLTPFANSNHASENNRSLTIKIKFGNRSFLLTGDIEKEVEEELIAKNIDVRADILKVAHHGSRTSSTTEFLSRVKPEHAIISVSHPSPFKHPHKETLDKLRNAGARTWRTDSCGAITISTNGNDIDVNTFIKCF